MSLSYSRKAIRCERPSVCAIGTSDFLLDRPLSKSDELSERRSGKFLWKQNKKSWGEVAGSCSLSVSLSIFPPSKINHRKYAASTLKTRLSATKVLSDFTDVGALLGDKRIPRGDFGFTLIGILLSSKSYNGILFAPE